MILQVLFLFVCATVSSFRLSLNNGDPCSLTNGSPGVCKVLSNCELVYQLLLAGHTPDSICTQGEFQEPVVCCPTSTPTTASGSVRRRVEEPGDGRGAIARQKCTEYSRYVYTLEHGRIGDLVNVSQCAIKSQTLITGGVKADRMEFPHMAAIGYNLSDGSIGWHCGGTLISENFVLTAAHCTYSQAGGRAALVRVGDMNLVRRDEGASPQDHRVIRHIRHPQYHAPSQYHDIALLRLESQVTFNKWVRPACLHTAASTGTEKTIATGWGRVDWLEDEGSSDLLKVTLPLVDQSTCNLHYSSDTMDIRLPNGIVKDWIICAGEPGRDTCQGDSGGPLTIYSKPEYYCMYDIVGITSLGKICGSSAPGVYTRVYHYVSWIESIVWGQE